MSDALRQQKTNWREVVTETLEAVVERLVGDAGFREWHANINEARADARAAYLAEQQQERECIDPLVREQLAAAIREERKKQCLLTEVQKLREERDTLTSNLHEVLGVQIPLVDAAWAMRKRAESAETEFARLRERDRWIPVGERLPDFHVPVRVYLFRKVNGLRDVTAYRSNWGGGNWAWNWPNGTGYTELMPEHVTHWSPLPAPPEGEKPHRPFDIPRPPKDKETTRFPAERERKESQ